MTLAPDVTESETRHFSLERFSVEMVSLKGGTIKKYGVQFKDIVRMRCDGKYIPLDSNICDSCAAQT